MKIRYVVNINPHHIFGMVGRCGGGYNTVWEDWSEQGRKNRKAILKEWEVFLNEICGHYKKLEESILKDGMRNPLIVSYGIPLRRDFSNVDDLFLQKREDAGAAYFLEGFTGGSRLHIAQKHNNPVNCIVNADFFGMDNIQGSEINSIEEAAKYYKDVPTLRIDPKYGLMEVPGTLPHHHLDGLDDASLNKQRGQFWIKTMKKYGYEIKLTENLKKIIEG